MKFSESPYIAAEMIDEIVEFVKPAVITINNEPEKEMSPSEFPLSIDHACLPYLFHYQVMLLRLQVEHCNHRVLARDCLGQLLLFLLKVSR